MFEQGTQHPSLASMRDHGHIPQATFRCGYWWPYILFPAGAASDADAEGFKALNFL